MPHPIKALKAAYAAVIETLSDLSGAIHAQTAATADLQSRLEARLSSIEAAAIATKQATAYLSSAERHRREQSGQRSDFGDGQ